MNATLPLSQAARCECQKRKKGKKKKRTQEKTHTMILIVWPACMLSIGILTLDLEENTL